MAFQAHLRPHHVHIDPTCTNHTSCPAEHWLGGRPERDHPHHVEFDGETGEVGYTRLENDEIAVRAWCGLIEAIGRDILRKQKEDARAELVTKADPATVELLKHLGLLS